MRVIALIPARSGSKQVPMKNFKPLASGLSCVERAIACAWQSCLSGLRVVLSTDLNEESLWALGIGTTECEQLLRPADLASDTTPMIDVVKHALDVIPGSESDVILLLQPTQPLRQPKHLRAAVELLEASGADSVVSVVELPKTHSPEMLLTMRGDQLERFQLCAYCDPRLDSLPTRRQHVASAYLRDGTVYAFRRRTVTWHGTIYGQHVRPLIIPSDESAPLDTQADWDALERRLRA